MPGDSVTVLALRVILGLFFVGLIAWMLFIRADREAERLFNLKKFYHLTKKDDATELRKQKKALLIVYSVFLVIVLLLTAFFAIELWKRL